MSGRDELSSFSGCTPDAETGADVDDYPVYTPLLSFQDI